jgi:hypothetical protein
VKRGAAAGAPDPDELLAPNVEWRFSSSSEAHLGHAGRRDPITSASN